MNIKKSTDIYTLYNHELDSNVLAEIFNQFKDQMTELNLGKKFNQYNYEHSELSNPQWVNLELRDHWYLKTIYDNFGLEGTNPVINISHLPVGYKLAEHKDIGRRTVLLIPISGVDSPVCVQEELVNYANSCLLLDSTVMHSVPTTQSDRVTLQFAFKQRYSDIASKIRSHLNKDFSNGH